MVVGLIIAVIVLVGVAIYLFSEYTRSLNTVMEFCKAQKQLGLAIYGLPQPQSVPDELRPHLELLKNIAASGEHYANGLDRCNMGVIMEAAKLQHIWAVQSKQPKFATAPDAPSSDAASAQS